MKFRIYRDSDCNVKPCKNAYPVEVEREVLDFNFDEKGEIVWSVIKRKDMDWVVEINTLEELMELQKEVRDALLIDDSKIEIYD